jgi:prepilin-type N-terminal cleavage/methylation domain-containing protein
MRRLRLQHGFTVLESMVAMTVLLVGLGGGLKLLDAASATTTASKAREQATALAREMVETARTIPFERLQPTGTAAVLQAANDDLSDAGGAGWTIRRRGITYTVAAGACTLDHASDGIGAHDASFCATGAGTTTADRCRAVLGTTGSIAGSGATATMAEAGDCGLDRNLDGTVDGLSKSAAGCTAACSATTPPDGSPADAKRVVVLVRWDRGTGDRFVLLSSTVPFTGAGNAPAVAGPDGQATITSGTSATYTATTDVPAGRVEWTIDGSPIVAGTGSTVSGSGQSFSLTWWLGAPGADAPATGEVLDGVHTVALQAFGVKSTTPGQPRALTVTVNRRQPYAVRGLSAGRVATGVLVEWAASPEGDVIGYRVLRRSASGGPTTTVCALTTATTCRDAAPPATDTEYWAVALDRNAGGAERLGDVPAERPVVRASNAAPAPVSNLAAARTASGIKLTWTASPGDPDPGDRVTRYRIYRDGTTADDRLAETLDETTTQFVDEGAGSRTRTYWVTAVDTQLGESTAVKVVVP